MLPSSAEYGRRLAAIMPTALETLKAGVVSQAVIIVIDGLGWVNLRSFRNLAPNLLTFKGQRITTVAPSTTAAALTTLTTGTLPVTHGLLGYKIMNPANGKLTQTLKEWQDISVVRNWQRSQTIFEKAKQEGFAAQVFARPAHEKSGFTAGVLTGAEYLGAQKIVERFALLTQKIHEKSAGIYYLYVDELDKIGHENGAGSLRWQQYLQVLDTAIGDFMRELPQKTGVIITADHGMINLQEKHQRVLEDYSFLPQGTVIGGEPRMRYFYLPEPLAAHEIVAEIKASQGSSCYVGTRNDWLKTGIFGELSLLLEHETQETTASSKTCANSTATNYKTNSVIAGSDNAQINTNFGICDTVKRLGDVIMIPRKRLAYITTTAPLEAKMQGYHGGLDDDETGIPLLLGGAFKPHLFY